MTTRARDQFSDLFMGPRDYFNQDDVEVKRPDGTGPIQMKFMSPLTLSYNAVTDRYEVGLTGPGSVVPDTRTIFTVAPLLIDGGASADLSADVTLTLSIDNTSIVVAGGNLAVGAISDTQHGNRSGGALHALAIPGSPGTAGFLSGVFAQDLTNATATALSNTLFKRDANAGGELTDLTLIPVGLGTPSIDSGNAMDLKVDSALVVRLDTGVVKVMASNGTDEICRIDHSAGPRLMFDSASGDPAVVKMNGGFLEFQADQITFAVVGTTPLTVNQNEVVAGPKVSLNSVTPDPSGYQTGSGVTWFGVATVEPTAAPATGVYMWYFGGNLKVWKAGAGAPAVLA